MKKMNKTTIITTIICLIPVIAGIILYPNLPDQIATHWASNGQVNGYSSKLVGAIILPLSMAVVNFFIPVLLRMDPKYKNMSEKLTGLVMWIIPAISVVCCGIMLSTAVGKSMRVEIIIPMLVGLIMVFIGNYLPKTKQSYTMGIKLPWTLNSEENWNATHRVGGYCFVIGGLLIMIGSLTPLRGAMFIIAIILMIVVPTVYSYRFYKIEQEKKQ